MEKTNEWVKFLKGDTLSSVEQGTLLKDIAITNTDFGFGEVTIALGISSETPVGFPVQVVNAIFSKFRISSYRSLQDKISGLVQVMNFAKGDDVVTFATSLEKSKFIYGLLPYISNIENDMGIKAMDTYVYDLWWESGFIDRVLAYCKSDYEHFLSMVEDALDFTNIEKLCTWANMASEKDVNKLADEVKGLRAALSPKQMDQMADILAATNPEYKHLKSILGRVAMDGLDKGFSSLDSPSGKTVSQKSPIPSVLPKDDKPISKK